MSYDASYPGSDNGKGFGSGVPTRKAVGGFASFAGNLLFPGLGFLTGPIASKITQMIQNGASQRQVQQVVQQYQQNQGGGSGDTSGGAPQADTSAPVADTPPTPPSAGVGIDPWGNPADPGEWWSNDFGRWATDKTGDFPGGYNLAGPGGGMGQQGTGFGAGTVGSWDTAIGFGGNLGGGGPTGAGRYMGGMGLAKPFTEEQYGNLGANMKYPAPALSNAAGGVTKKPTYQQYLSMWNPPSGMAGAQAISKGTPMKMLAQMGTSDVNPGLKIFQSKLLRKPKKKKP